MTPQDARRYRKMNADVDRRLKRADLRPMAEAWPPDPVTIGPFGMRRHVWETGFVVGVLVTSAVLIVLWLLG